MLWNKDLNMVKTTVQVTKDKKWRIVLPEIVRKVENLQPGDYIELDIKKIEKSKKNIQEEKDITKGDLS